MSLREGIVPYIIIYIHGVVAMTQTLHRRSGTHGDGMTSINGCDIRIHLVDANSLKPSYL